MTALDRAPAADAERLSALLARLGLPTGLAQAFDVERLLARMQLDKKNLSGQLRLILWRALGAAELVGGVDPGAVRRVLGPAATRA